MPPDPECQALISSQRDSVCRKVTHGMKEWWKDGMVGLKSG